MKSKLGHIYLYVSDLEKSYKFYKELLELLDYKEVTKQEWGFAFMYDGTSIWFEKARKEHIEEGYHRKRIGLNHIAFRLISKEAVDQFVSQFIIKNGIKTLYDSPKMMKEYQEEYFAVYFEDPDRIKLEVAYYE